MSKLYEINLIPQDLRREEAMQQIADSLQQIDRISSDICRRVDERVSSYRQRVYQLNDRLNFSRTKIEKLKERTKKAVTVFAPAKYPDALCKFESAGTVFPIDERQHPIVSTGNYSVKSSFPTQIDVPSVIKEKQLYYSVKTSEKVSADQDFDGKWGKVPDAVQSVANLVVFNTGFSP